MQRTTPQQREVLCMGVIIAFGLTKKKPTDGRTHEHLRILRKRTLLIGQATPDEREQARKFCQYIAENWVQQT